MTEQTDRQTKCRADENEESNMNRLVDWLAMFGSRPANFSRLPVRRQGVSLHRHGGDSPDIFYPYWFLRPEHLRDEGMFSWSFQVGRLFKFCLFCSLHFESHPLVANSFALEEHGNHPTPNSTQDEKCRCSDSQSGSRRF